MSQLSLEHEKNLKQFEPAEENNLIKAGLFK